MVMIMIWKCVIFHDKNSFEDPDAQSGSSSSGDSTDASASVWWFSWWWFSWWWSLMWSFDRDCDFRRVFSRTLQAENYAPLFSIQGAQQFLDEMRNSGLRIPHHHHDHHHKKNFSWLPFEWIVLDPSPRRCCKRTHTSSHQNQTHVFGQRLRLVDHDQSSNVAIFVCHDHDPNPRFQESRHFGFWQHKYRVPGAQSLHTRPSLMVCNWWSWHHDNEHNDLLQPHDHHYLLSMIMMMTMFSGLIVLLSPPSGILFTLVKIICIVKETWS